jgi:hypothetical protein
VTRFAMFFACSPCPQASETRQRAKSANQTASERTSSYVCNLNAGVNSEPRSGTISLYGAPRLKRTSGALAYNFMKYKYKAV